MKNLIGKIKFRWNVAPTWVKVLDISCWVGLIILLGIIL